MDRAVHAFATLVFFLAAGSVIAQTGVVESEESSKAEISDQEQVEIFEKMMNGIAMVGTFTIVKPGQNDEEGKEPKLHQDRYEIQKVKKMKDGDYWIIQARIKYGDKDRMFPVPVEVKWAGKTPVITVDNLTIPGMGTFDARVLISGKRYAGTWRHDAVVGHMFGMLEKAGE